MIKNRFVLIDAFALIFRAYYALPPSLSKDGHPIQAAYGFASAVLSAIRTLEPEYLAVGMDFPKPTLRHKEYIEYKAHRPEAPADLISQIPYTKEFLKVMNIPTYAVEGYEGEDVIASILAMTREKKKEKRENIEYIIVTGDMDLLQLIDENTRVYSMARGINQAVIYDKEKVMEKYGLEPSQFVDFKALKGDASDNIPGVKGVGEKTASKLIQEFDSLNELYKVINPNQDQISNDKMSNKIPKEIKISEKIIRLLTENKEQAYLSQKLSTIQKDAPLEFKLEDARVHEYNKNDVIKLFNSLGFKSLITRLPQEKNNVQQGKLL